jgi:hypothetical protein
MRATIFGGIGNAFCTSTIITVAEGPPRFRDFWAADMGVTDSVGRNWFAGSPTWPSRRIALMSSLGAESFAEVS